MERSTLFPMARDGEQRGTGAHGRAWDRFKSMSRKAPTSLTPTLLTVSLVLMLSSGVAFGATVPAFYQNVGGAGFFSSFAGDMDPGSISENVALGSPLDGSSQGEDQANAVSPLGFSNSLLSTLDPSAFAALLSPEGLEAVRAQSQGSATQDPSSSMGMYEPPYQPPVSDPVEMVPAAPTPQEEEQYHQWLVEYYDWAVECYNNLVAG